MPVLTGDVLHALEFWQFLSDYLWGRSLSTSGMMFTSCDFMIAYLFWRLSLVSASLIFTSPAGLHTTKCLKMAPCTSELSCRILLYVGVPRGQMRATCGVADALVLLQEDALYGLFAPAGS